MHLVLRRTFGDAPKARERTSAANPVSSPIRRRGLFISHNKQQTVALSARLASFDAALSSLTVGLRAAGKCQPAAEPQLVRLIQWAYNQTWAPEWRNRSARIRRPAGIIRLLDLVRLHDDDDDDDYQGFSREIPENSGQVIGGDL